MLNELFSARPDSVENNQRLMNSFGVGSPTQRRNDKDGFATPERRPPMGGSGGSPAVNTGRGGRPARESLEEKMNREIYEKVKKLNDELVREAGAVPHEADVLTLDEAGRQHEDFQQRMQLEAHMQS